jgi:hypothetical protein
MSSLPSCSDHVKLARLRKVYFWLALGAVSCSFDRADRWIDESLGPAVVCNDGDLRCNGALERCDATGTTWQTVDDCPSRALVCSKTLLRCATCEPGTTSCNGATVTTCNGDGSASTPGQTCDGDSGFACRQGVCQSLCTVAASSKSNVGCEYWAVDLDNAVVDASRNAAAQQFAVVISNPQPDVRAQVTIEQDDSAPGQDANIRQVAEATILPESLETFNLGPREVDGSPDGEFNTGTGTALTRHAYRIKSQVPIVAYQFNPLENVNVFSNDASLLKPVEALTYDPGMFGRAYVVVSWPQTIASTDDPNTNFDPQNPTNLRSFLAIVGTRPNTRVRVTTTTRVIPGGPVADTPVGGIIDTTLQPFEVLNLETGGANADFTSSLIDANQPIAVFPGSEASDAPVFQNLAERFCCADHLEEQLDPIRTAGHNFVLAHTPSRTQAIKDAGGNIGVVHNEPEFYRLVAVSDTGANVTTTLPPPDDQFFLSGVGAVRDLTTTDDVMVTSDGPLIVGDVQAGQQAAFVPNGLPGGDPSLIILPPIEQYRSDYVFLTPDKYSFDFIVVVAPRDATTLLDGVPIDPTRCHQGGSVPGFWVYQCQLSFPRIDNSQSGTVTVSPGIQNDGVHRILSSEPVGVLVFGWDNFVSYGYAAGTQLQEINPPIH